MRLADAGKLLLSTLLLISIAAGEAAAQTKPAKKRKTDKKSAGAAKEPDKSSEDANSSSQDKKTNTDEKANTDKKGDTDKKANAEKKPDAKSKNTKDKAAAEKKAEPAKPATCKVKKGPFHVEVSLDGVFEAQNQAELVVRPQEWPQLQVLKAVEHGTPVKQGDLVLALETDKIDRTIAELRSEMQLNELGVKQSEAQLAALEKINPLDADANQRAERMTKEDWKQFQQVEKPLSVKENEFRLKMYQEFLEYAEEEYRQLEKMYKADDLKEETEKIVLRRARTASIGQSSRWNSRSAAYEENKKLGLPRMEERAKELTDRALD